MLLADHQLQPRPDVVNRADLDIDQCASGQHDLPDDIFGHVGLDLARALRPGHPDHAVGRNRGGQGPNAGGEVDLAGDEDQHQIAMAAQSPSDRHTVGQLPENGIEVGWRIQRRHRHARFDA
jgi:hypothetical protein